MGPCLPAPPEPQSLDLDLLDRDLHVAPAVTALLFRKVIESGACTRLSALRQMGKTITLDPILESGAWTDAAITLIGFELPSWSVRRLVCEDGEWLCSLSRQPNLPIFLDELAEGNHSVLALAVLRAFVAARCRMAPIKQVTASVPRVRRRPAFVLCCDNFA
jgi:hypothetical protein